MVACREITLSSLRREVEELRKGDCNEKFCFVEQRMHSRMRHIGASYEDIGTTEKEMSELRRKFAERDRKALENMKERHQ